MPMAQNEGRSDEPCCLVMVNMTASSYFRIGVCNAIA